MSYLVESLGMSVLNTKVRPLAKKLGIVLKPGRITPDLAFFETEQDKDKVMSLLVKLAKLDPYTPQDLSEDNFLNTTLGDSVEAIIDWYIKDEIVDDEGHFRNLNGRVNNEMTIKQMLDKYGEDIRREAPLTLNHIDETNGELVSTSTKEVLPDKYKNFAKTTPAEILVMLKRINKVFDDSMQEWTDWCIAHQDQGNDNNHQNRANSSAYVDEVEYVGQSETYEDELERIPGTFDGYEIYIPHTRAAAIEVTEDPAYGPKAIWCTGNTSYASNYFNNYRNAIYVLGLSDEEASKKSEYYVLLNRNLGDDINAKMQIHPETGQFLDVNNREHFLDSYASSQKDWFIAHPEITEFLFNLGKGKIQNKVGKNIALAHNIILQSTDAKTPTIKSISLAKLPDIKKYKKQLESESGASFVLVEKGYCPQIKGTPIGLPFVKADNQIQLANRRTSSYDFAGMQAMIKCTCDDELPLNTRFGVKINNRLYFAISPEPGYFFIAVSVAPAFARVNLNYINNSYAVYDLPRVKEEILNYVKTVLTPENLENEIQIVESVNESILGEKYSKGLPDWLIKGLKERPMYKKALNDMGIDLNKATFEPMQVSVDRHGVAQTLEQAAKRYKRDANNIPIYHLNRYNIIDYIVGDQIYIPGLVEDIDKSPAWLKYSTYSDAAKRYCGRDAKFQFTHTNVWVHPDNLLDAGILRIDQSSKDPELMQNRRDNAEPRKFPQKLDGNSATLVWSTIPNYDKSGYPLINIEDLKAKLLPNKDEWKAKYGDALKGITPTLSANKADMKLNKVLKNQLDPAMTNLGKELKIALDKVMNYRAEESLIFNYEDGESMPEDVDLSIMNPEALISNVNKLHDQYKNIMNFSWKLDSEGLGYDLSKVNEEVRQEFVKYCKAFNKNYNALSELLEKINFLADNTYVITKMDDNNHLQRKYCIGDDALEHAIIDKGWKIQR